MKWQTNRCREKVEHLNSNLYTPAVCTSLTKYFSKRQLKRYCKKLYQFNKKVHSLDSLINSIKENKGDENGEEATFHGVGSFSIRQKNKSDLINLIKSYSTILADKLESANSRLNQPKVFEAIEQTFSKQKLKKYFTQFSKCLRGITELEVVGYCIADDLEKEYGPSKQIPTDEVAGLYQLHKKLVEELDEIGYRKEQSFWISFAITSLYQWDDNSENEIRLSEIFALFLTIYAETIDRKMPFEQEQDFLALLKQKYDAINNVLFEVEDVRRVALQLGRTIFGPASDNIVIEIVVASKILEIVYKTPPLSCKLIKDI